MKNKEFIYKYWRGMMELRNISKAELDKIIDNHKRWLQSGGKKGERANLSYADLSYADLRHADLSYADLSYAKLIFADLRYTSLLYADLNFADLRSADLRFADLTHADLNNADLDYSAFPLWCGGLDTHIDDRQATQLLYHLIRNVQYNKNTSEKLKRIFKIEPLVKQANEFLRVQECGEIELDEKREAEGAPQ